MLEAFFSAVLSLMLMHPQPPITAMPYQPPMMAQLPQPPPPLPRGDECIEMLSHNGSLMLMSVWPDKTIKIAYSQPKPELYAIGVRPGTLLVRGQWRGDRTFVGVAHVYNYCGAIPYAVTGCVD